MAAGLGFKDFTTGEVLTAADVDGYLMQGVLVFASSAARDAAITSPQEGQFAFLKDTNTTMYYTGSAWTNLDTTGLTNPMTTTGDMIYSSPGSTPVRLGIGSAGQVLTVASGIPSWATASGGGKLLQVVTGTTTTSTQIASTTYTDTTITATITPSSASSKILVLAQGYYNLYRGNLGGEQYTDIKLVRASTDIYEMTRLGYNFATNESSFDNSVPIMYMDSPSTTSATTYKIQSKVGFTAQNGKVTWQNFSIKSNIQLLEIGA